MMGSEGVHPELSSARASRWGAAEFQWRSLEDFLATSRLRDGVHAVPLIGSDGSTLAYEFFLRTYPGAPVLAHFHGNAPRSRNDLPMITGLGIAEPLPCTLFVPSDPLLDRDPALSLGWHIGPATHEVHRAATAILGHIAVVTGAPRVVAWGGSGGGFAAMRVARDMSSCIAFVWNPQTNVDAYVPASVRKFRDVAGIDAVCDLSASADINLAHDETWARFSGRVVYLQESTDWHVRAHLLPLVRAAGLETTADQLREQVVTRAHEHLIVGVSNWGSGHAPPPKPLIMELLGELTRADRIDLAELEVSVRSLLRAARASSTLPTLDSLRARPVATLAERACSATQSASQALVAAAVITERAIDGDPTTLPRAIDACDDALARSEHVACEVHAVSLRAARTGVRVLQLLACATHGLEDLRRIAAMVDALAADAERLAVVPLGRSFTDRAAALILMHAARHLDPEKVAATLRAAAEPHLTAALGTRHSAVALDSTAHAYASAAYPIDTFRAATADSPGPGAAMTTPRDTANGYFIYGSCVSRDAFELKGAPLLDGYASRSSIASAFAPAPIDVPRLVSDANPSAFQRRMVMVDVRKELTSILQARPDGDVILDFIDERLDLVSVGGSVITLSPELVRSLPAPSPEALVRSGSPEHRKRFALGLDRLLELVSPERIILNRVYWASFDERGHAVASLDEVHERNRFLDECYRMVRERGVSRELTYDDSLVIADSEHRWGVSPFHYVPELYRSMLDQLAALAEPAPGAR